MLLVHVNGMGVLCNKCYSHNYNIKNRKRISEKGYKIRSGEYKVKEIIHCIECMTSFTSITKGGHQRWHRIFEEGIMIGWQCYLCYNDYNAKTKLVDRNILKGIRGLGKFDKPIKVFYCQRNKKEVRHSCIYNYSNGTMECEQCKTKYDLGIDHLNDDGLEERKKTGIIGGYHFYLYLYKLGYPEGYRVLCRSCNSKDYNSKKHIIIPRRYINEIKYNPQKLKEYKEQLLELFNILNIL